MSAFSITRARSGSTTGVVDLDMSDVTTGTSRPSLDLEDVSLDDVDEHLDTVQADLDALLTPPPTKTSMAMSRAASSDPGSPSAASDPRSSTTSYADVRFSNVPLSAGPARESSSSGSGIPVRRTSSAGASTGTVPALAPAKKGGLRELKLNGGSIGRAPSPASVHRAAGSASSLSSVVARSPSPLNPSKAPSPKNVAANSRVQARSVSHKKSASLASLTSLASSRTLASHDLAGDKARNRMSSGNLPFLLQRLDLQKSQLQQEGKDGARVKVEELARMKELQATGAGPERPVSIDLGMTAGEVTDEHVNGGSLEEQIDWDFWGSAMADYRQFATENPERLAKAIERGIPQSLRGMMWQLMSASHDVDLEATYLQLLKETSPQEKAIQRDLGRTFPRHEYFMDGQGVGQENLFNVLKAYSLYDPEVGYCQGLCFVVAILLLNMPDEEAFCLLVRLMKSYDLRGHFLPEMPGLQLRLYQFDRLLEELLPVLHVHFLRQGVKSSMYCSQWFLTMFSYYFPLEVVFRIYDNVLASGIEAIFAFSIMLLQKNEEALLKLKFDEILSFMKTRMFEQYIDRDAKLEKLSAALNDDTVSVSGRSLSNDSAMGVTYLVDQFVQEALSLKITPFMLDVYAHEHEEFVRVRDAHMVETDELRNSVRSLTAKVKTLEDSIAQKDEEHCEMVKELVMNRLGYEELEKELVRYKLLYAEAVHENADREATSSQRYSSLSLR